MLLYKDEGTRKLVNVGYKKGHFFWRATRAVLYNLTVTYLMCENMRQPLNALGLGI